MPSCARCNKAGRTCAGYQRYPVSLNRTALGLEKRNRLDGLDEAKTSTSPSPNSGQAVISTNDWRQIVGALVNPEDNRMLSQLSATPAFDSHIISLFFERYSPANNRIQDDYGRAWLKQAIGLQNPGEALRLSLKAISMTRMGRISKDDRLLFQGGKVYGSALQQLRKALQSEVMVWHNETLAAGIILALYGVSPSKTRSSCFR